MSRFYDFPVNSTRSLRAPTSDLATICPYCRPLWALRIHMQGGKDANCNWDCSWRRGLVFCIVHLNETSLHARRCPPMTSLLHANHNDFWISECPPRAAAAGSPVYQNQRQNHSRPPPPLNVSHFFAAVPTTCSNGLPGFQNGAACCKESCGQCGGVGCGIIPGTGGMFMYS